MPGTMRAVVVLLLAAFVVVGLIWIFQRSLIYFPTQAVAQTPPGAQEVTYQTEDGLTLAAWLVPAKADRLGTVVVFNGNAGNRTHRAPLAQGLSERGYEVLLVDYRGYGGNPGSPSESGLAADARAAVSYLKSRPDLAPLVYFGESLGAGVAVGLAETEPPEALVLRSPFTSLPAMGRTHYPFLPATLLLWDRYPNLERLAEMETPVMVIAGSADTIVPAEQSRRLYEAAPGAKRLLILDGADHNDFELVAGEKVLDEVAAFLDEVLAGNG